MEEFQYIVNLFGDSDPAVMAAVDRYFKENGSQAIAMLQAEAAAEMVPDRKRLLENMLVRYNKKMVISYLKDIAEQCASGAECPLLE